MSVEAILGEAVIGTRPFQLNGVSVERRDGAVLWTARSVLWDDDGIKDIKEQECFLGDEADVDGDRGVAYANALVAVAGEVIGILPVEKLEVLMPADFTVPLSSLPKTAQTQEQLEQALRSPKRVGGLLK